MDETHRASVNTCITSTKGNDLLAQYGDKTHSVQPIIGFVPTIIFGGVRSTLTELKLEFQGIGADEKLRKKSYRRYFHSQFTRTRSTGSSYILPNAGNLFSVKDYCANSHSVYGNLC